MRQRYLSLNHTEVFRPNIFVGLFSPNRPHSDHSNSTSNKSSSRCPYYSYFSNPLSRCSSFSDKPEGVVWLLESPGAEWEEDGQLGLSLLGY